MVIEVLLGFATIISILMQPSKADALSGLIQGNSTDSFFAKNKSRTKEAILEKSTAVLMLLFVICCLAVNIIK